MLSSLLKAGGVISTLLLVLTSGDDPQQGHALLQREVTQAVVYW